MSTSANSKYHFCLWQRMLEALLHHMLVWSRFIGFFFGVFLPPVFHSCIVCVFQDMRIIFGLVFVFWGGKSEMRCPSHITRRLCSLSGVPSFGLIKWKYHLKCSTISCRLHILIDGFHAVNEQCMLTRGSSLQRS